MKISQFQIISVILLLTLAIAERGFYLHYESTTTIFPDPDSENLCHLRWGGVNCDDDPIVFYVEHDTDRGFFIQACPLNNGTNSENVINLTFVQEFGDYVER